MKYSRPALKHPTNVLRSNKAYLDYTLIYGVNPVGPIYKTHLSKARKLAGKTDPHSRLAAFAVVPLLRLFLALHDRYSADRGKNTGLRYGLTLFSNQTKAFSSVDMKMRL